MPIKGLSSVRRLPRAGRIRLGVKVKHPETGNEYPKATNYFVCPPEVQAVYGAEPKELRIMFPVENPEIFFSQWYMRYSASHGLLCKGDGEEADELKNGYKRRIDCEGKKCPFYIGDEEKGIKKSCAQVGMLQFLLPDVPGVAVWQITTGSYNSIVNINSAIDYIRDLCGRIAMIPLILRLGPQEVTPNGKKKKVYVLSIDMNVKLADLQKAALVEPTRVALPPPDESELPEHYEEAEVIEDGEEEPLQPKPESPKKEPAKKNSSPPASEEKAGPSDEEKADIHRQELLEMPVKKRLELIYELIDQKHYTPPSNSIPADKLSTQDQVEYILFLEKREGLPFK